MKTMSERKRIDEFEKNEVPVFPVFKKRRIAAGTKIDRDGDRVPHYAYEDNYADDTVREVFSLLKQVELVFLEARGAENVGQLARVVGSLLEAGFAVTNTFTVTYDVSDYQKYLPKVEKIEVRCPDIAEIQIPERRRSFRVAVK